MGTALKAPHAQNPREELEINMKLRMTTPDGTRDLLYSEADLYEDVTKKLAEIYESAGFSRIATPSIENYDLIASVNPSIKQESIYKLTDNTGHLIAIRPDNTTPIARVVATKLRNATPPLKLYYNQNIFRINSDYSGKRNEILQSGIELIGASGIKSDLLCITTALDALKCFGLKFKLEIGHVGFFNALIAEMNLSEEEIMTVRSFVEAKNFVSLNMFDENLKNDTIRALPLLYGNEEVFESALKLSGNNPDAIAALNYVRELYELLKSAGYADDIMIDMGMVHKFDYYTGTVFRGYIDNAGEPVLKGGRYDKLLSQFGNDMPATGFAINICAAVDSLIKSEQLKDKTPCDAIIHFDAVTFDKAVEMKKQLLCEGIRCELSVFDTIGETQGYAEKLGIGKVIDLSLREECEGK